MQCKPFLNRTIIFGDVRLRCDEKFPLNIDIVVSTMPANICMGVQCFLLALQVADNSMTTENIQHFMHEAAY